MIAFTAIVPMTMPVIPRVELEVDMQMLSNLTTASTRSIARHAYWLSLLADPCVILCLGIAAKELDHPAEHAAVPVGRVDHCRREAPLDRAVPTVGCIPFREGGDRADFWMPVALSPLDV